MRGAICNPFDAPLIGTIGAVVYVFDGEHLWLTHVCFQRAQRAARAA